MNYDNSSNSSNETHTTAAPSPVPFNNSNNNNRNTTQQQQQQNRRVIINVSYRKCLITVCYCMACLYLYAHTTTAESTSTPPFEHYHHHHHRQIQTITIDTMKSKTYDAMPALFGRSFDDEKRKSHSAQLLQFQNDANLCPNQNTRMEFALDTTPLCTSQDDLPVALLVSRGDCSFEEKAKRALTLLPLSKTINYVIIYDDNNNNDKDFRLPQMVATDDTAQDIPLRLFFVSYETGFDLRKAINTQQQKEQDCDNPVVITFHPKASSALKQHHHLPPKRKHGPTRKRQFTDNDNDDDDDYDYYGNDMDEDPTRELFLQMITALALMFMLFFCIGCWMVCCCGGSGDGGWFTIHLDGNGIVFARSTPTADNDNNDDDEGRLLTPDEVLSFPQIEFTPSKTDANTSLCCKSSSLSLIPMSDDSSSSSDDASTNHGWNAMCSICLEEYTNGEMLCRLPCHHMFHTECIVPWLTERYPNCPLCKANVLPTHDDTNSDGQDSDVNEEEVVDVDVQPYEDNEEDDVERNLETNTNEGEASTNEQNSILSSVWRNSIFGRPFRERASSPSVDSSSDTTTGAVILDSVIDDTSSTTRDGEVELDRLSNLRTPLLQDARSPGRRHV